MKHLKTWEYHLIPVEVIKDLKNMFNQYFKSFDLNSDESLQFELGLDDLVRRLIRNMPMISEFQTDIEWARVNIKMFIEIASEASNMSVEKTSKIAEGINMLADKSLAYVIKCKKEHKLLETFETFHKFLKDIDSKKHIEKPETGCILGGLDEHGKGMEFEKGDHVKLYALKQLPYDFKTGQLIDNDATIATIFADTVRFRLSNGEVVELCKDDVRAEKIALKSDFSKKMVNGLMSSKDGYKYATYNAFKIELDESNPDLVDEFEYRMSDESPIKVIADIYNKCPNKTAELDRLALKVSAWKD